MMENRKLDMENRERQIEMKVVSLLKREYMKLRQFLEHKIDNLMIQQKLNFLQSEKEIDEHFQEIMSSKNKQKLEMEKKKLEEENENENIRNKELAYEMISMEMNNLKRDMEIIQKGIDAEVANVVSKSRLTIPRDKMFAKSVMKPKQIKGEPIHEELEEGLFGCCTCSCRVVRESINGNLKNNKRKQERGKEQRNMLIEEGFDDQSSILETKNEKGFN
jgi:hypothetical protein